jgi:hypothetical protein
MCIALGHDLLEDTQVTTSFLKETGMSDRVVSAILALTKKKGRTIEQYKAGIFANEDAMRVKLCDLRHNSDIRRLKGVTQKDLDRLAEYAIFYKEIEHELRS